MVKTKRFLIGIRWAIFLILLNYVATHVLGLILVEDTTDHIFLIGRIAGVLAAGWLVVWNSIGRFLHAALAGAFLVFLDHVVLKGGYYLLVHFFSPESLPFSALRSFYGVLISYVMFVWIPIGIAMLGAVMAKLYMKKWPPNSSLDTDASTMRPST